MQYSHYNYFECKHLKKWKDEGNNINTDAMHTGKFFSISYILGSTSSVTGY